MTTARFTLVDVFTDVPFAGNQLGVFTDARGLTGAQMQALARELNFSECTFVLPPETTGQARMRIFTPAEELPFAGHPTLGTAWVLAAPLQRDVIELECGQGIVPVTLERDASGRLTFGRMTQPLPTVGPYGDAEAALAALGVGGSLLPVEVYDNGVRHVYVRVSSADEVAGIEPDMVALARLGTLSFSVFAADGPRVMSRVFVPGAGVPEDPATGSAAGPLAVHLARHEAVPWGEQVEISQGAQVGRPSTLFARAEGGPDGVTAVEVGGSAVIVGRGELVI